MTLIFLHSAASGTPMLATRVGLLSRVLLASNARIPGVTRSFLTSATTSSPTEASAEATKPTAKKTTTAKSATKKTPKAKSEKKVPKPKKEKSPSALDIAVEAFALPKKPPTSWIAFSMQRRADLNFKSTPSFSSRDFIRESAKLWRELPESERDKWSQKTQPAWAEWKERYKEFIEATPRSVLNRVNKSRKKQGVTALRAHMTDPKPLSSFFRFAREHRQTSPLPAMDASKEAGEKWRNLSEAEKAPYKEAFEREYAEWKLRQPAKHKQAV